MVSFRFHLVSLVAVFLALGLGILTGTTVLNRSIVTQLERQTDQLIRTSERQRRDIGRMQRESEGWNSFGGVVSDFLLEGRLRGEEAILVTQEATDSAAIDRVRRGLETAGAKVAAVLSVDSRMALETSEDVPELAAIVGGDPEDRDEARDRAAEALATSLTSAPEDSDPLEELLSAGFVRNLGPGLGGSALRLLGEPGQVVVVVGGGVGEPVLVPRAFLVPFVEALARRGARVAATEGLETEYPFVGLLRSDGGLGGLIVTQDNVDQVPGEVSLVLALEDLIDDGQPGHYGVKDGADAAVPPLS